MAPRIRRLATAGVLQLGALVLAHQLVYLARYGSLYGEALVHAGLSQSKGQAKKDIEGGGVYINNVKCADVAKTLTTTDLLFGKHVLLRKGKRTYAVLRLA